MAEDTKAEDTKDLLVARAAARNIRFDIRSPRFLELAQDYRKAVEDADRLRVRIDRAERDGRVEKSDRLGRKLEKVEAAIELAHARLMEHTRRTARGSLNERARPAKPVETRRVRTVWA